MYDEYEEKAAALVRSFEQEVKILQAQLEQMEREMTNEPAYRAEWESGQKQAAALNKTLHRAEARLNDLRRQHQELELKQHHLQDLQTRLQQARTDGDELERAIAQTQQKIDRYQTIIAQQDAIKAGHRQLQQAQTEQADWNRRLAQSSTLSAEQHRLETAINRATAELEAAIRHTETTLNDLRPKA
ncbi:MAG: hypothetical protein ACE5G8_15970, partial [Anaerolineae bacterium]